MGTTLAFDSSPLSHFARAGQLETLRAICSSFHCVVTDAVFQEVQRGTHDYPALLDILDADWLERVGLRELDVLGLFAEYARVLGSSRKGDVGEAATLAWAEAHGATVIIDERAAVNVGRHRGVETRGTLRLVADGINARVLTEAGAVRLVGALLDTSAWFPFSNAEDFLPWARSEGLIN